MVATSGSSGNSSWEHSDFIFVAASVPFSDFHDETFEVDQVATQFHYLADTEDRTPSQKDHTAIRMVELIEQRPKLLLRQDSWRFEALADSFEFDQGHRFAFQRNQFPEHSFLEEAVHETSNMASGFRGQWQCSEPILNRIWFGRKYR